MKKQEVIKQAYGEHWEKLKDDVDENGWLNYKKSRPMSLINFFDVKDIEFKDFYSRPKSLQGIENNNGWIEYSKDLKLKGGYYHLIALGEPKIDYYSPDDDKFEVWNKSAITHYQPIQKPLKPLY